MGAEATPLAHVDPDPECPDCHGCGRPDELDGMDRPCRFCWTDFYEEDDYGR